MLPLLRAFAKLRHVSVRLSIRPHVTNGLPLEGFSLNLAFEFFENLLRKFKYH
jgi:hypothetical protein